MIELVEKSDAELSTWLATMMAGYHEDLLKAGMTNDEADQNLELNRARLLVDDRPAPGQHILNVLSDGEVVGTLWLGHQADKTPNEWFIYDIEIDEASRGAGLGRATMLAAEQWVTAKSGTRLALNVFGPNTVARRLYESLDYQVISLAMYKDLAEATGS
jgi:ribosomal protein S18 acetylase RimI-like enzyme